MQVNEWVGHVSTNENSRAKRRRKKKQKGYLELRVFRLGRYQRWGLNLNWVERER